MRSMRVCWCSDDWLLGVWLVDGDWMRFGIGERVACLCVRS